MVKRIAKAQEVTIANIVGGKIKMCGILGVFGNRITKDTHRNLFALYFNQYNRGAQGAGALIKTADTMHRIRGTHPSRLFAYFNAKFWRKAKDGSIILFHHRYPTSTDNKPKCNHPIANEAQDIFIIHNGVMGNTKKDLEDSHVFETQDGKKYTDSEVVVHLIEEQLKEHNGDMAEALKSLPKRLRGSYAFAIVHGKEHKIYLLKNYMPIVLSKDADGNTYFSSEALLNGSLERIKEMGMDELGYIDADGYHTIVEGKEIKPQFLADWKEKPIKDKSYNNWDGWDSSYWRDLDEKQQAMAKSHSGYGFGRLGAW